MESVGRSTPSLTARALALFALLALTVRLLVPAGFMPDASQGGYRVMLCTGEGMVTAWVGADGKLHDGRPVPKKSGDQQCAFAAAAGSFVAPELPSPDLPSAVPAVASFAAPQPASVGRGLAAPPPPATGPPAYS